MITTTNPMIDAVLDLYAMTLDDVNKAVADIPDSRMTEQPSALVNHPAWTLSHLGVAAALICQLLDEPLTDAAPDELTRFGPGSKPVADSSQYSAKAALLATLRERHARAVAAVRAKHAEWFDRPPPEPFRKFAPTIGRIVVYLLAAHESYHLGQLRQWRRVAGITSS